MVDSYTTPNGTADHALFENQQIWAREGYGVISGCGISLGSGDYDVAIDSGEVLVAGGSVSIDAQTVTLSSPGTDPRWDVLSIDDTNAAGNRVVVTEGVEQPPQTDADNNRLTQLESAFPVPPSFDATPSTIIGIVWVDPDSSQLASADLINRRVSAETQTSLIDALKASIGKLTSSLDANNKDITNAKKISGETLEATTASIGEVFTRVTLSSNQSFSSNTVTKIAFDSVLTDEPSAFDAANNKYIAPADGKYHVESNVRLIGNGSAGDVLTLIIKVNGAEEAEISFDRGVDFQTTDIISATLKVTKGDEIEIYFKNENSADETTSAGRYDRLLITREG